MKKIILLLIIFCSQIGFAQTKYKYDFSVTPTMKKYNQLIKSNHKNNTYLYGATMLFSWDKNAAYNVPTIAKNLTQLTNKDFEKQLKSNLKLGTLLISFMQGMKLDLYTLNPVDSKTKKSFKRSAKDYVDRFIDYGPGIFMCSVNDVNSKILIEDNIVFLGIKTNDLTNKNITYLELYYPETGLHILKSITDFEKKYLPNGFASASLLHFSKPTERILNNAISKLQNSN